MIRRTAHALLLLHVSRVLSLPQGYPSYDDSELSSYPVDPEQNPQLHDSSEDVHDSFELSWKGDGSSGTHSSTPDEHPDIVPDDSPSDSSAADEGSDPVPVFSTDSYKGLKDLMDNYFALAEIYQGLDEEGKSEFTKKLEGTEVDSPPVDSPVHDKRQAPDPLDNQIEKTPITTTSSWDKVFSTLTPEKAAQLRRFLRLFKEYGGKAPGPEDGMASYVDYMTRWQDQLSSFDEGTRGVIVDLLAAGGPLPSDAALGVRPSPPRAPLPSGLRPKSKGKGKNKGKVSKLYRLQLWQSLNEESKASILASIAPSRLARRQTDDSNLLDNGIGAPVETAAAGTPTDENAPTEAVEGSPAPEDTTTLDATVVTAPAEDSPAAEQSSTPQPTTVESTTPDVTGTVPPEGPTLDPALDPGPVNDAPADPTLVDPTLVDPALVGPVPLDPTPVDPGAVDDPVIVDPVPVESPATEPSSETPVIGVPAEETPIGVTPTLETTVVVAAPEETPATVVTAEETSVAGAPVDETPVTEPAVESPALDVPAGETTVTAPAAETPAILPSVDETPLVEPLVQGTSVVETPVEGTPTVLLPTGTAFVSETAEDTPTVLPATDGTIAAATVVEQTPTPVVEPVVEPVIATPPVVTPTEVASPVVVPAVSETFISPSPPSQTRTPTTTSRRSTSTTSEPATSAGTPPPRYIKATVAGRPRGQLRPTPIPGLPAFVNTWPDWALPLAYDWPEWAQRFGPWPNWMPWDYPRGGPGWRRLKAGLTNWFAEGGETKKQRKRCGDLAGKLSMRFLCDEE